MGRKTQYNKITSPDKLAAIHPDNLKLKQDFLSYLKSIQRSAGTIAGYDNDLCIVFMYLLERCGNKKFVDVKKREWLGLQSWLIDEHGNSPARVRRIKATISSLSNYITDVLQVDEEPGFENFKATIRTIENPRNEPVREKTILTDQQCQLVLDTLCELKEYEKACMFALGIYSGRRKAELVRFKTSYFNDECLVFGSLYKTPEKILTKGNKYLTCYVLKGFKPYFDRWMTQRAENGIQSEWLFPQPGDPTQHRTGDGVTSWASTYEKILGVPAYYHMMRHKYATYLSENGIPNDVIQAIIGWSSADMCNLYIDTDTIDELGKYFDENGIKQVERKTLSDL